MFEKGPILQAVRTKLNAAKARKGLSWAQLFKLCDADGSGTLDFAELIVAVRKVLGVLEQTVCIYDLKVLFGTLDMDGGGDIALSEFVGFLQHGPVDERTEAYHKETKIRKVRKRLQEVFRRRAGNEYQIRLLFKRVDADGEGSLDMSEFTFFIRKELKQTEADISSSDLKAFYKFLDEDGGGLEVEEVIQFVCGTGSAKPKDAQSVQLRPTFREQLLKRATTPPTLGGILQPGRQFEVANPKYFLPLEEATRTLYPSQEWRPSSRASSAPDLHGQDVLDTRLKMIGTRPKASNAGAYSDTARFPHHSSAFLAEARNAPARNRFSCSKPKVKGATPMEKGVRMDIFA